MKKISILVPCYNEVGNVREMANTLICIMTELLYDYEIVFVDNCSTDGTKDILRELAANDQHVKVLMNNRNYGTDGRSIRNAMHYLCGDVIIYIACDLQEPPELIPEFLKYWEQGYKVVCGQKIGSQEGKLKYACRSLFYKIIADISDTPQYKHISGITLLDKEVLGAILKIDYDIGMRYAFADMGYDVKLIPYEQHARKSGKSSYNLWRYLSYAINSLVITSNAPLRLLTICGALMSGISFLVGVVYLVLKLIILKSIPAGTVVLLIGILFLCSVQLLFIGIIGEYIGVVLRKVTRGPEVVVGEKINFKDVNNNLHASSKDCDEGS